VQGLAYADGFLIMNSGDKILVYQPAAKQAAVYTPTNTPDSFVYHDAALYVYTWTGSGTLVRIPLDKPLRRVVEYSSSAATPGAVLSLVADDTNIYWVNKGRYDGLYRVMKVAKGSPGAAEELFRSNSELRDLNIYGGRVYFSCLDSCGGPGWFLANIAPDGGSVTAGVPLADDPLSFYQNGTFYVADTVDHQTRSLYRVDVERRTAKLLLRDLPYTSAGGLTVKASSKWLYIGADNAIARFPFTSQGTLGSEEIVAGRRGDDVTSLMPASISTDGVYLYFWNGGVKRVAE
jgi:hypothetical protein